MKQRLRNKSCKSSQAWLSSCCSPHADPSPDADPDPDVDADHSPDADADAEAPRGGLAKDHKKYVFFSAPFP